MGAIAKWRRHYGEPKGLSGKSSCAILYVVKCELKYLRNKKTAVISRRVVISADIIFILGSACSDVGPMSFMR